MSIKTIKKLVCIEIGVILLKPKKYSLLKGIKSVAKEIHVYPGLEPWFVTIVYRVDFPRNMYTSRSGILPPSGLFFQ